MASVTLDPNILYKENRKLKQNCYCGFSLSDIGKIYFSFRTTLSLILANCRKDRCSQIGVEVGSSVYAGGFGYKLFLNTDGIFFYTVSKLPNYSSRNV
jgi:hypothetical protein